MMWEPAVHAGIVPVLIELLALLRSLPDEEMAYIVAGVSGLILVPAISGGIGPWAVGLLRALARLLSADPPMAAQMSLSLLYEVGAEHPDLVVDCRTWGIEDSLQRLTLHSDPKTAESAVKLQQLFFPHRPAHVSSSPTARILSRFIDFPYCVTMEWFCLLTCSDLGSRGAFNMIAQILCVLLVVGIAGSGTARVMR